ncbi:hypothetical protein MK489_20265 [Myxococcota bacterium]|nr:hypothetical protein [Myxococcota bacterium]
MTCTSERAREHGTVWRNPSVWSVAMVLTLANAFKPLVVDDAAYFQVAQQVASHPFDPYGFPMLWRDAPMPALFVLAPPGLPYWWAAAIVLFGDNPIAWKLWLFPIALLLAWAVRDLGRRFAPGFETPLLWLCVASPAVLPFFNLMLDVPALSMSLGALALFLRACEEKSRGWALCAGGLAGIALQTKYPSVFAVIAILGWAGLTRQLRLAVLALGAAAVLFVGWETFLAWRYGESHFLIALHHGQGTARRHDWGELAIGTLSLLGGLMPAVGLLAAAGLGAGRRGLMIGAGLVLLLFAAIALLPERPIATMMFDPRFTARNLELFLYLPAGILTTGLIAGLAVRALRSDPGPGARLALHGLLLWAAIESAGLVWATPFLAVRRVLPLIVCLTLLTGASLAVLTPGRTRIAAWVAGLNIAIAGLFAAADFSDAWTRKQAVQAIANAVHSLGGDPRRETIWVAGHWGYQFYTKRHGMTQIIPGRSILEPGDWVVSARHVARQRFPEPSGLSPPLVQFSAVSPWPWSTLPYAYAGVMPLRAQPGAQLEIDIQRVIETSVVGPPPEKSRPGQVSTR